MRGWSHDQVTTNNSGALPWTSQPSRGRQTFVPLADFLPTNSPPSREAAILGDIAQIEPLVTNVIRYRRDGSKQRIWPNHLDDSANRNYALR